MFDWPAIFNKKGFSPMILPLAPLAFLYGVGVRLRRTAYQTIIKPKSLPGTVISVGNLTVGGTGKTPAVCMLTEWAFSQGHRVAILSRGYGGRYKTKILEVSDQSGIIAGPAEAGDEPYLLAKRLPGIPVIVSKDRHQAGLWGHHKYKTDFFILDDGFQHIALERDLDLVLLDTSNPFGNGHLLPWGPLREPINQLARAHAIVMTRAVQSKLTEDLSTELNRHFPGKPLFKGDHIPEKVIFPNENIQYDSGFLRGKRVMAFAGIGQPESFKESLLRLGADVLAFKTFKDHHIFNQDEFQKLIIEKENSGAEYLITTEKDWVRLEKIVDEYRNLAYLTIRFQLLSGQDQFFNIIKKHNKNTNGVK